VRLSGLCAVWAGFGAAGRGAAGCGTGGAVVRASSCGGCGGGMMAAGIIVGTFWVMNHKLPGFGIHPEGIPHPEGGSKQFGLIYQGFRGASPWVDMGTAIGAGLWVCGLCGIPKGRKLRMAAESVPRLAAAIVGGAVGGAIMGLVGWTGANLFGYR